MGSKLEQLCFIKNIYIYILYCALFILLQGIITFSRFQCFGGRSCDKVVSIGKTRVLNVPEIIFVYFNCPETPEWLTAYSVVWPTLNSMEGLLPPSRAAFLSTSNFYRFHFCVVPHSCPTSLTVPYSSFHQNLRTNPSS